MRLVNTLPVLNKMQVDWISKNMLPHVAYQCKDEVWCSDCAFVFKYEKGCDEIVCPNCKKHLKVEKSRRTVVNSEKAYVSLYTTRKGYQVTRMFLVERKSRKGEYSIPIINEAYQVWTSEKDGKQKIVARPLVFMARNFDHWDFSKPMVIKRKRNMYYGSRYEVWAYYTLPCSRFLPKLKRNGFSMQLDEFANPTELFKYLLSKGNDYEMLIKTKQYKIVEYMLKRERETVWYRHSINICNRNNYIVQDASMYFDYLKLLSFFGKDTYNAHYVCPKDLKKEHDKLAKKKEEYLEKEQEKEKKSKIMQSEKKYREQKEKFFGLCFSSENITIEPLKSVEDFYQEGKAMHHCVFANNYYDIEDSLILSAKDKKGDRVETIEIDLNTFKVLQSRGKFNSNTEYHQEIISLINGNIEQIKAIV